MTPHQYVCALRHELTSDTERATTTPKGCRILCLLQDCITALLAPPPTDNEQRVSKESMRKAHKAEQRVIDDTPIITIPRITNALGIMEACNLTAKQNLKVTPYVHQQITWNNTPVIIADPVAPVTYVPIPSRAQAKIVTQHPINLLTCTERDSCNHAFTSIALLPSVVQHYSAHFEHFACPMVHPITGKTFPVIKGVWVIQQQRHGRQLLGGTLMVWHKETIKQAKKGQTLCSLWRSMKSTTCWGKAKKLRMAILSLTDAPKTMSQIVSQ